jgi:hypothetical protein
MSIGQDRRPVALWPAEAAPDLRLWQEAAQGPEAGARTSAIAFTCAKPRCEVEIDGLGVTLEQGWSMTAPAWRGATAGAPPLGQPRVEFLGPDRRASAAHSASLAGRQRPLPADRGGGLCLWHDGLPHGAAVPLRL